MLRTLKNIKPDIIYQRVGMAYTGIAAYYARKNNCKMLWHIASEDDLKPYWFVWKGIIRPFHYIDKKFKEYGIKNSKYIIGQVKYQNELLKKKYGKECDLTVPNFHPVPKNEIRKENPVKVVWIANFKKGKQPEIFIKLAEEFKDYKDVKFTMIGRPGKKSWQAELESKIDLLNNLEYFGEKPIGKVNRILCESHIFVNTSRRNEGFPNTFIQAWMRRVPVVSLNVDPDDILVREGIGFHSKNIENMVNDLKNLISNRDLREEMGERAQKYAFENLTVEKNAIKIVNLF